MRVPIIADLLDVLLPRICRVCKRTLLDGEVEICLHCQARLPRVHSDCADNEAAHRLFGRCRYEYVAAYFYYRPQDEFAQLIKQAKYNDWPSVNHSLARMFAAELSVTGWPYDIDVIVPVPIHWVRWLKRGYNQSIPIARALGEVWQLPVENHCLYKSRYTASQVGHSGESRRHHVRDSFALRHTERLEGKHILLVDDVMTTGATLEACATVLQKIPDVKLSFLTLGLAN